MSYYSIYNFGD